MGQKKNSAVKWTDIKRPLNSWGRAELIGLIHDLFNFSAENKEFLAARLVHDASMVAPIKAYRRRIIDAFNKADGYPELAKARDAIRNYEKASSDTPGTLDLMLTYVETGTDFTREYGDMYAGFYDSLCSVLDSFARKLANIERREQLEQFRGRLETLAKNAKGIGWGYGDYVCETVARLTRHNKA